VGLGRAIRSSALTGIFRAHDRPLLSQREQHAIHTGRSGDIIGIQALSGRFYINTAVSDIEAATRPAGQKAKMRFLVINPTSRSAILRAVADSAAIEDIGSALQDWSWDKHCHSKLYSDVHDTLRTIAHLRRAGCDVEVRLSAADLSCAMLLTRKSMFVEQYVYGRSKDFIKGVTLGGEQPVLEYTRRDESGKETEERILQSSFEVLWDSYSMAVEDYLRNTAEIVGFERELDALLTQVSREEPESVAKLVILAAGYGTQFSAESDQTSGAGGGKPKALLPIGGRPIIEWLLEGVDGIKEIADIIIVTNDKYLPAFVSWRRTTIQTKWRKLRIISDGTSSYDDRRGALGTLHFAVSREGIKGNLIILSGDNFFEHGIREIVDSFFAMRSSLVVVHPEQTFESARRFGVVEIDEERHIVNFEEKPEHPKTKIVGTGCYVLTQKDVRGLKGYVRDVERTDNMGEFIRYLIHQGSMVSALEYRGKWCDIGTYADYEDLRQTMED
jgi:glucose-1-phosphate thymidylyltransferase